MLEGCRTRIRGGASGVEPFKELLKLPGIHVGPVAKSSVKQCSSYSLKEKGIVAIREAKPAPPYGWFSSIEKFV